MNHQLHAAVLATVLLLSNVATTFAEWNDGSWPLEFDSRLQSRSTDSSSGDLKELSLLLERNAAEVQTVELIFLDRDTVVVRVQGSEIEACFPLSSRELIPLQTLLEETGFELVAASKDGQYLLYFHLFLG